jgi:protein-tyrosine phosphatase
VFRPVELGIDLQGRLYLHSMPGRNESWDIFAKKLETTGVDLIVCLTPIEEIEEGSPSYAEAISQERLPCTWLEYPIEDFSVPHDRISFTEFVGSVAEKIMEGDSVLIHCAGGIGRTGTFAACVLQQLGLQNSSAIDNIRRAGSGPETSQQNDLVLWHAGTVNI